MAFSFPSNGETLNACGGKPELQRKPFGYQWKALNNKWFLEDVNCFSKSSLFESFMVSIDGQLLLLMFRKMASISYLSQRMSWVGFPFSFKRFFNEFLRFFDSQMVPNVFRSFSLDLQRFVNDCLSLRI